MRKAAEYAAGKEGRYLRYQTRGTCSTAIDLEIETDVITHCQFTNECRGNTSCPDQLSRAIEQYYQQHAE